MKRVLLIVNGQARVGKDTVTTMLKDIAQNQGYRFKFVSSIESTREFLIRNGFPVDRKNAEDRRLLQEVGDALERYNQFKTTGVINTASVFFAGTARALFVTHVREPEIIDAISRFPWDEIKVKVAPLFVEGPRGVSFENTSDVGVRDYVYPYQINNDSSLANLNDECVKLFYAIMENL